MSRRAIHFITQEIKNSRGLSLVEVIIAAAVLAIISAPVITGFTIVAMNQIGAQHMYISTLLAESLLTEVRGELEKTVVEENFFSGYSGGVHPLTDLLPEFQHDGYICTVAIKRISSGEVCFFTEDTELDDMSVVEYKNSTLNAGEVERSYNYTADLDGEVEIPTGAVEAARILCDSTASSGAGLHILNKSEHPAVLHVFGNRPQITYENGVISAPLLVQYFDERYLEGEIGAEEISATVSVYDDKRRLLKRMGMRWKIGLD